MITVTNSFYSSCLMSAGHAFRHFLGLLANSEELTVGRVDPCSIIVHAGRRTTYFDGPDDKKWAMQEMEVPAMLAFYIKKLDGQLAPGDEQAFAKAFRDRRMLGYHFWSVEDIRRHQEYFGEVTGLLLAAVNIMPRLDLPGPAEPDGLLAELIKAIFEALQLGTLEELRRRFEDKELVFG